MPLRKVRNREPESNTQRIEAFSDGVFAIAITLLILEIKIPNVQTLGAGRHLSSALIALWPSYLAYVFTFVVIGIYWANHHYIFRLYSRTDHAFNLLNVLFLMCISFLPLPTAILGQYVAAGHDRGAVVIFYDIGLLLPAASWHLMWLYGSRRYRLIDKKLAPGFVTRLSRQYAASTLVYALSLVVAYWSPGVSLVCSIGLTILYLLPPPVPEYIE